MTTTAAADQRGPDITASLDVDCLDVNLYRSKELWVPARARGVFGGQVIGQAVMASNATVREDVFLHSLHCYFLLAGDKSVPILYHVKRLRDGGSYVTRSVEAVQRGRCIFTIMLSYQKPEPAQPSFALPLPRPSGGAAGDATSMSGNPALSNTAPPEGLDALPGMYDANGLPTAGYEQAFWMRTREAIVGGEDEQKAALAYASDFYLLSTIPKALGNSKRIKMMASLDHSMWFYDSFDTSQWMLFVMQTQAAGSGRGVAMGRVYRQDGTLVAVVSQEGLVRGKLDAGAGAA
ncbi:Acyl-CoA thioesterase [Ceraceosorus bombacis]|uniref:Acyl-CoA thioesterase n=1 Tax=Ceraceosorus bombacis TaxID=401625 RepID=A0A0P1B9H4_9BASI|nr:Acyl-CoA thioesterase [Ceraceosorus bombacis]